MLHRKPIPSLSIRFPAVAGEWHPTRNQQLHAADFRPFSNKKVWWKCRKGHEWTAAIANRTLHKSPCPFCACRRPSPEYCLESAFPVIAGEWHPTKNGRLRPVDVLPYSNDRRWWKCRADSAHAWRAIVNSRTTLRAGCPLCAGTELTDARSLAVLHPEIAKEWHPSKNGRITPIKIFARSNAKRWWKCAICSYPWETSPDQRIRGNGCPQCSSRVVTRTNCLATVNPTLAAEWHPTKNGALTPSDVLPNTSRRLWWQCQSGHDWLATGTNRNTNESGCPKCVRQSSRLEIRLLTELMQLFPGVQHRSKLDGFEVDIAIPKLRLAIEVDGAYWHRGSDLRDRRKNRAVEKLGYSILRVREYGLPAIARTDICLPKKNAHDAAVSMLLARVVNLTAVPPDLRGRIERYLRAGQFKGESEYRKLLACLPRPRQEQSLAERFPRIAAEWEGAKNGFVTPRHFPCGSGHKAWWRCQSCDHVWLATINDRTSGGGCPACAGKIPTSKTSLSAKYPELIQEWDAEKNLPLVPENVMPRSNKSAFWKCSKGHGYQAQIAARSAGSGCPFCAGKKVAPERSLAALHPELAREWDLSRNPDGPHDVTAGSNRLRWWKCAKGHSWQATVWHRSSGRGCPVCRYRE